jgi:hypothetical protein
MNTPRIETAPSAPRRLRLLLIAAAVWALLALLNVWKPIWLAPPWFTYTPAVYALLWLACLVVLVYAVGRYARHNWASLAAIGCLALQACLGCVVVHDIGIDLIELSVEQGSIGLSRLRCDDWSTPEGRTYLDCTLCMGSSDVPQEMIRTYLFRTFSGWPLMFLLETRTYSQPADPSRSPCRDGP